MEQSHNELYCTNHSQGSKINNFNLKSSEVQDFLIFLNWVIPWFNDVVGGNWREKLGSVGFRQNNQISGISSPT